jgi:hypothetical protein
MMTRWIYLLLILSSAAILPVAALAQSILPRDVAMSEDMRRQMNTFFSNFSEASLPPFREGELADTSLIQFALSHININAPRRVVNGRLAARHVDTVSAKYFGRTVRRHQSVGIRCADSKWEGGRSGCYQNGYYSFDFSDGEAFAFSQIVRLVDMGDRRYTAYVNLFRPTLDFEGDPHGTVEE